MEGFPQSSDSEPVIHLIVGWADVLVVAVLGESTMAKALSERIGPDIVNWSRSR